MKMVAINAFLGWRMSEKANFLESKEEFGTLDHYREALTAVESLADFVYVVYRDLLVHSENLANEDESNKAIEAEEALFQAHDINSLVRKASVMCKKRILFFN